MCINKKRFFNRWTHSWQWMDCGKCESCQQHKAMLRAKRIKNACWNGYVTLFVTLTYRNINIPYIRRDELYDNCANINIYRDCSVRRVRSDGEYHVGYRYTRQSETIKTVDCFQNRIFLDSETVSRLSKLRGQSDNNKIGVLYFKDVQDFEKRLRVNVKRWYGIEKPLYFWTCSELGPSTQRPHFHILISVPQESVAECSRSIIASWPYDSRIGTDKGIQIARDAASYVSSYVNKPSSFSSLHSLRPFRPKHSFSLGYGRQNPAFSLGKICESIRRSDMRFTTSVPSQSGGSELVSILYPKYVLNYYFPKFTGFSRLNYDEIAQFVSNPVSIYDGSIDLVRFFPSTVVSDFLGDYDYDWLKVRYLVSQVNRCYKRFIDDFEYIEDGIKYHGLPDNDYSRHLYADYLYRCWVVYSSTLYRQQFENVESLDVQFELYDNWDEVIDKLEWQHGEEAPPNPLFHILANHDVYNPNQFKKNIIQSEYYRGLYHKCLKQKKVTNRVESRARNV